MINNVLSDGVAEVLAKNRIVSNTPIEIIGRRLSEDFSQVRLDLRNEYNEPIEAAHAGQKVIVKVSHPVHKYFMLREMRMKKVIKNVAKNTGGVCLIIIGCMLIFTPGPGLLTILAGLYIKSFPGKPFLVAKLKKTKILQSICNQY